MRRMECSSGAAEEFEVDSLAVRIFPSEADLARAAASHTAEIIRGSVARRGQANVAIATGNSQVAFVNALHDEQIPWHAVTVFHLDEYVGIRDDHPASFRRWLREMITEPFQPAKTHYLRADAPDPQAECRRYEQLLRSAPLDLACIGIGENGHIAFNEPHQANFNDPCWLRIIELDDQSRAQQVGEGHFATLEDTPVDAISLTVPALLSAHVVQVVVPEERKATAVQATLSNEITPACPATILRRHERAILFLDPDSASQIDR